MSETNENKEPGAVGSDSNEGLGAELTSAYFAGFHSRDEIVALYKARLRDWLLFADDVQPGCAAGSDLLDDLRNKTRTLLGA